MIEKEELNKMMNRLREDRDITGFSDEAINYVENLFKFSLENNTEIINCDEFFLKTSDAKFKRVFTQPKKEGLTFSIQITIKS